MFKPLCMDSHRLPTQQRSKYELVVLPVAAEQGTIVLFILKSLRHRSSPLSSGCTPITGKAPPSVKRTLINWEIDFV